MEAFKEQRHSHIIVGVKFIHLFIRLEVVVFMFNRKGTTLIESLFAFEIFISVFILFISLFSILYKKEIKIHQDYQLLLKEEGDFTYSQDYVSIIEMVLL